MLRAIAVLARAFPLVSLEGLLLGGEPVVVNGPVGVHNLIVLGCFHLLWEIEVSLARASHLRINETAQTESLFLPVSKTDPGALGCWRTWTCLCSGEARVGVRLCPYHVALDQVRLLTERFGSEGRQELPLFPTAAGSTAAKAEVVSSLRSFLRSHVSGLLSDDSEIGGHSLRVTGAQFLAGLGIEISVIMLMAR